MTAPRYSPGLVGSLVVATIQPTTSFLGAGGSARSDVFSLGVIAYHMLTGRLPYGTAVAAARTRAQQSRLRYTSALDDSRDIAQWVDHVLKKAVHPDPLRRYSSATEFAHDLRHPAERLPAMRGIPLLERNPAAFWKLLCLILVCVIVAQVAWQSLPHR